jgi:hypothetical protein
MNETLILEDGEPRLIDTSLLKLMGRDELASPVLVKKKKEEKDFLIFP